MKNIGTPGTYVGNIGHQKYICTDRNKCLFERL
jgi:hypothetical protein